GAGRRLGDGAEVETGRRELGHEVPGGWPPRVRSSFDGLAHELRLPAGQLDEPVEGHAGLPGAPERERDEGHGAADRFDRDVLTRLRPARFLQRGEDLTM